MTIESTSPNNKTPSPKNKPPLGVARNLLDMLPLACFFIAYQVAGLLPATAVMVVATIITLIVIYVLEKRVALLPLLSGSMVCVFGIMTLVFHDETFIKMRPTVVNAMFGVVLLVGAVGFHKGLLRHVFSFAFQLSERGWLILSRRWGLFFLLLAVINELVWRSVSTEVWVNVKVFGYMGLTLVFTLSQMRLIARETISED